MFLDQNWCMQVNVFLDLILPECQLQIIHFESCLVRNWTRLLQDGASVDILIYTQSFPLNEAQEISNNVLSNILMLNRTNNTSKYFLKSN